MKTKEMTLNEVMTEVIIGVSNRINKKALKEVIAANECNRDYNDILFAYYQRVHRNDDDLSFEFIYQANFKDSKEFKAYCKEYFNTRFFVKTYDYKNIKPIKFYNTGLIIGYNNGWRSWSSFAFNMYQYIETNKIEVVEV